MSKIIPCPGYQSQGRRTEHQYESQSRIPTTQRQQRSSICQPPRIEVKTFLLIAYWYQSHQRKHNIIKHWIVTLLIQKRGRERSASIVDSNPWPAGLPQQQWKCVGLLSLLYLKGRILSHPHRGQIGLWSLSSAT